MGTHRLSYGNRNRSLSKTQNKYRNKRKSKKSINLLKQLFIKQIVLDTNNQLFDIQIKSCAKILLISFN